MYALTVYLNMNVKIQIESKILIWEQIALNFSIRFTVFAYINEL